MSCAARHLPPSERQLVAHALPSTVQLERGIIDLPRLATPAVPSMASVRAAREHIEGSLIDRLNALGRPVDELHLPPHTPSAGASWDLTVNARTGETVAIRCRVQRRRIRRLAVRYEIAMER